MKLRHAKPLSTLLSAFDFILNASHPYLEVLHAVAAVAGAPRAAAVFAESGVVLADFLVGLGLLALVHPTTFSSALNFLISPPVSRQLSTKLPLCTTCLTTLESYPSSEVLST